MRYDGTANTIFNLNSYFTEQELVDQIAVLEYIGECILVISFYKYKFFMKKTSIGYVKDEKICHV